MLFEVYDLTHTRAYTHTP